MTNFFQTNVFKANPTLANAKRLVEWVNRVPSRIGTMSPDDTAAHTQAQQIVADAKDPAKFEEAMQRELQARFRSPNIVFVKA